MIDRVQAAALMDYARKATERAYVPYSQFPVGAAVLTANGEIFAGANIENASHPLACCAERTAIYGAVNAGHTEIAAVAVTAPRVPTVTPCGGCRQVLNEFRPAEVDVDVILDGPELTIMPLSDLLPRAFGPRDLEWSGDDHNRSSLRGRQDATDADHGDDDRDDRRDIR